MRKLVSEEGIVEPTIDESTTREDSYPENIELGMVFFSNGTIYTHEADWASSGLRMLGHIIAEHRNDEGFLTSNHGGEMFETEVFTMRPYCWCDGEQEGHEEECPPNFEYKPTGLKIAWYKHAGRGITSNMEEPTATEWFDMLTRCRSSIK